MKAKFALRKETARPIIYILSLALAIIALPPAGSVACAADNPNLSGTWKLNQNQSDNPREKMREAMGNAGPQGQGGGPGGGFGNRQGGGRGRGAFQNQSQLTIEQNGQSVKISGESGNLIAQTSDNSNAGSEDNSAQSSNPGQSNGQRFRGRRRGPETAQWKDNQLVVENSQPNGGKMTRTYSLSADGKQLYVTTEMQNPRFDQPVTFRLVYDSAKSE